MIRCRSGVIVPLYNNSILMAKYLKGSCKGYYTCPGGKLEEGESPIDAAIREAKEEAGLEVDKASLVDMGGITFGDVHADIFVFKTKEEPKFEQGLDSKMGKWSWIDIDKDWFSTKMLWPYKRFIIPRMKLAGLLSSEGINPVGET